MMKLVTPKTCTRCKGEGFVNARVVHYGVPGTCYKCDGAGVVEGDKARLAEYKLAEAHAQEIRDICTDLRRAATEWDRANHHARITRYNSPTARLGADLLEIQAPARFIKAARSFAAGRQDVLPALVTWLVNEATPTH